MTRLRLPAVAGTVLMLCLSAAEVWAAPYHVYYKPTVGSKWTFFSGKPDRTSAEAAAKDLRDLGFEAGVLFEGEEPKKPAKPAGRSQHVTVNGAVTLAPGYVGAFRTPFGPDHRARSRTVHHYHHAHAHATAKASAKASAKAGHPTPKHPSRTAHSLQRQHQRAKPPSFSHHHAQHHVHVHAHHHGHGKR